MKFSKNQKPGEAFSSLDDYDSGIRQIIPHYDLMQDVIISMISSDARTILELGSGTGELTIKLLNRNPSIQALCIDYSSRMIDYMKTKVENAGNRNRVQWILNDFSDLDRLDHPYLKEESLDACISMLAVHHLEARKRMNLIRHVYSMLKPGGHFWIADVLIPKSREMEVYYLGAREKWLMQQNLTQETLAAQMIDREASALQNHDMPDSIHLQLEMFESAGFRSVDILWKYFGTGIFGGIK